jgi:RNA-directed DNA polymerase
MTLAVQGEVSGSLSGSKSVARAEDAARNLGSPGDSRRTNCGGQAGREAQRQGEPPEGKPGIRLAHSNPPQGPRGSEAGEGADTSTQSAKETSPVRTTESSWRTSLRAIATKAAQDPRHRFGGLYRLLNEANLRQCFYDLRKAAAPGVDGVTFEDYEKNLEGNLQDLVRRLKNKSYHVRLVRRKYIPKGQGKWRPLGIPTLEDKLVQEASAQILAAICEADFLPCSYGYRPERDAHQAVKALTDGLYRGRYEFVVEADIKGFFEHIRWDWLLRMLALRVQDGAFLGLIRKWLRAGILEEDGRIEHPENGTPQGGVVSPVLANVYLHYVLDLWFERRVRKGCQGACQLFRYADDFVCVFERRHEAERFMSQLSERLQHFGLEVAPDKTRLLRFGRNGGEYNGRFDFLGFEFRWENSRKGFPIVKRRTAPKKLRGAVARFKEWVRTHRHTKLSELMDTLRAKYQGHWNYYGIIGNSASLDQYRWQTTRILFKWLNRRSQRRSYTWRAFNRLLYRFEVPWPRIVEKAREGLARVCRRVGECAQQAVAINLFGQHYRPSGGASELR